MSDAILVENLMRRFGGGDRPALDSITLRVPEGVILELLGPSGSGKSTLLNLLGGMDRADSGRIVLQDIDITRLSETKLSAIRGRLVGTVFQHHCLPPGLRALDAVAAPLLWTKGVTPEAAQHIAEGLLAKLGLTDQERCRHVQFLSGGQRQRVAFARAIAPDPAILLADEPTAQLDAENAVLLLDQMLEWADGAGKTLVLATHDSLRGLPGDRITARLDKGRLVEMAPTVR